MLLDERGAKYSMSISADAQALRTHFFTHFRDDIRVVIDNDIPADMAEGETWVRFTVRPAASFHVAGDTEAGMLLQQGRVWLQTFTPLSTGDGEALEILDHFAKLFRHAKLDDGQIRVFTADIDTNPDRDGEWYMMTASIPYEALRRYD
jgi:hypothetical protein